MFNFVFNIIICVFSAILLSWMTISKSKAMKKIEKEKGEVIYISGNKVLERVCFMMVLAFLVFIVINLIVEKEHSISSGIVLINLLNIINLLNSGAKHIITSSGIGFVSYSNRLIKFIQWDSIKDAHWNKYDSNILSITYVYLDSVKDEELKFNKKQSEKVRDIVGKYIEIN